MPTPGVARPRPPLGPLIPLLPPPQQDPAFQRHLLRLWLAPPEERPLPAAYKEIMSSADLAPGRRGGIAADRRPYVPLEATD